LRVDLLNLFFHKQGVRVVWDRSNRAIWLRCTVGILVTIAAAAFRWQFLGVLGRHDVFLTFYPAVAIGWLYGGFVTAFLTTVLSAAVVSYFWMEPAGQFGISKVIDLLDIIIFLTSCILLSLMAEAMYRARARAREAEEQSRLAAEREKAAFELQKSESKYRELVQNSKSAIIRWKRDGTITFFNEYAQRLFGYREEEILGRHVNILVPESESGGGSLTGLFRDIVSHPENYANNIHENILRDGARVRMAWTNRPIFDREGQVWEVLSVGSDITERKLAEEALRETEIKYQNLFDNMIEEVHLWRVVRDEAGQIRTWRLVEANPPTLTTWNHPSLNEIKGKTADEIFGPGSTDHYMPIVRKIMTEGAPYSYEEYFPKVDRYFRFTCVPFGDYFIATGVDISEVKKTEQELKTSEQRLTLALKAGGAGSFDWDAKMNINRWSDELLALYGLQPGEFGGRHEDWLDFLVQEDREAAAAAVRRSLETGEFEKDFRIRRRDTGEVRWMHGRARVFFDKAGQPIRMIGTNVDITEQKRAEEAVRHSEAKYRQIVQTAQEGIWLIDGQARTVFVNQKIADMLGFSVDELIGRSPREFMAPEFKVELDTRLLEHMSGVDQVIDYRFTRKDGSDLWCILSSTPIFDTGGRHAGCLAMLTDITKRKHAEQALRYSEERFRALVQASSDVMYRMNPEWSEMGKLYGRDPFLNTVTPSRTWLQDYILPEDQPRVMAAINEAIRKKSIFELEHRVLRVDGSVGWIFSRAIPLQNADGEIIEWFGAASNITERKEMEAELRKSRDQLELRVLERTAELEAANEKLRMVPSRLIEVQESERKRLAVDLHDSIGQTLAALKFRIEYVIEALERKQSDHALKLLLEFIPVLQYSISETRAIYMGLKPTMLADYGILATLDWYRLEFLKLYPHQHIELETTIREEDIPEELKTTMFRIVQEALNNASKHAQSEWVDISLGSNDGAIELSIRDYGIGMDPDYVIGTSSAKSLGLIGMRERTELSGGEFTIKSAPYEGTTIKATWRDRKDRLFPIDPDAV
jgi:PAS domain S-box-containing protein